MNDITSTRTTAAITPKSKTSCAFFHVYGRDIIGDCTVAGDVRWGGTFGVNLDFVARSHCAVQIISLEAVQARKISKLYHTYTLWARVFLYETTQFLLFVCFKLPVHELWVVAREAGYNLVFKGVIEQIGMAGNFGEI